MSRALYTNAMQRMKRAWKHLPNRPRRALTFILGMLLVIASPIFGAIPGPGGMILFLLGIAILATEFTWAERVRDLILSFLSSISLYIRRHPRFSSLLIFAGLLLTSAVIYIFYMRISYLQ